MDSIRKQTAIHGIRKVTALFRCLNSLTDRMISVINQDRLSSGTDTNRNRSMVNPESIRLNPKIRSNLAPTKRISGTWVKTIAMPLKIFSFSSYGNHLTVRKYALCGRIASPVIAMALLAKTSIVSSEADNSVLSVRSMIVCRVARLSNRCRAHQNQPETIHPVFLSFGSLF